MRLHRPGRLGRTGLVAGLASLVLVAAGAASPSGKGSLRSPTPRVGSTAAVSSTGSPAVSWESPVTATDLRKNPANNSPVLAVDPNNSRFIVLANRQDAPDFDCSLQVSRDGGRLWRRVQAPVELPRGAEKCYAPEIGFDSEGVLYYLFVGLAGKGNSPVGAYLATSSDQARTFTAPRKVLGAERYMVRLAIDRSTAHQGRIHLVWLEAGSDPPLGGLAPPPNPIMHAFSDDGGRSFSRPVRVAGSPTRRVVAPALALGPKGEVHMLYYDLEDDVRDYQGLEGPVWEGNWSLKIRSSPRGGGRFSREITVDDGVVPPERVMLIFTMPPPSLAAGPRGELYAAWDDARNRDRDVFFRRSTDRGMTWRDALRLNDDSVGSGRHQYLPRLSVSPQGRVDALFLDRRHDPQNIRNDAFFASSSDGGASFGTNLRLSSESSHSRIGQGYAVPSAKDMVEFGSRLALLSGRRAALAAWTDTRNHLPGYKAQDIVAARISLQPR